MTSLLSCLEEAKQLEMQGKYLEAGEKLTFLIEQAQQTQDHLLAELFNQRGIVNRMLGQYDDSFADYLDALAVSSDNEQKSLAHTNMADIHRVGYNNLTAAHASLDEALALAEHETFTHAKALDQRGLVYMGQKNHDSAIETYQRGIGICKKLIQSDPEKRDNQKLFAKIAHQLGAAHLSSQNPEKVDEAYQSQIGALKIFTKIGDQQGIVNSINTLGKIAMIKNNPDEAIVQYEKALEILEQTQYGRGIAWTSFRLAEVYLTKQEPEKASPYLERFAEGIIGKEVTEQDLEQLKDLIERMKGLYASSELKVDSFEKLQL